MTVRVCRPPGRGPSIQARGDANPPIRADNPGQIMPRVAPSGRGDPIM